MYVWRENDKDGWSDVFSTIQECVEDAINEKRAFLYAWDVELNFNEIEVAKATPHQFEVDAYRILEKIEEELWEDFDMEYYFSDGASQAEILELQEDLTKVLNKWFKKTNTKPDVFNVLEDTIKIVKID
ncbi:MAG: hypothetical protein K2F59_03660 [Eubacteriales bacterium]|nr:hypothetical protein [Eubacteriales bacterium]